MQTSKWQHLLSVPVPVPVHLHLHLQHSRLTHIAVPDSPRTRKCIGESIHALPDSDQIIPFPRLVLDQPRRARAVPRGPQPEAVDLGRRVEQELGDGEVPERREVDGWD